MASKNDDVVMITKEMDEELNAMGSGLTPEAEEEMNRKAKAEQEAK